MKPGLADSYKQCEKLVKAQSTSFFLASRTLPPNKRKAIYAIYAFCRLCDDIVDNDNKKSEKKLRIDKIRSSLQIGSISADLDPIILAINDVINVYKIPVAYFEDLLLGMESDIDFVKFNNFRELKLYCHRVASVVGLMCLNIFGYEDDICKELAIDLGIAMQLTNIIRDVKEDFELNRVYLPKDDFKNAGYTYDDLENSTINANFNKLIQTQISRAEEYFTKSKPLKYLVHKDSQQCLGLIAEVYIRLLKQMNKNPDLIMRKRTKLTFMNKVTLLIRCYSPAITNRLFISR